MSNANRVRASQSLAGLVSPAAEDLFHRLHTDGPLRTGDEPDAADPRDPAVAELLDTGLAFRTGETLRSIGLPVALGLLLEHRQRELVTLQQRILDAATRLTSLLPRDPGNGLATRPPGVALLTGRDDIATHVAELSVSAKRRLRVTDAAGGGGPTPRGPARYQLIRGIDSVDTLPEPDARPEPPPGTEIRLRASVPVTMLHVDDAIALVTTDPSAGGALLVRVPALLAMLATWFDLLWSDPATVVPGAAPGSVLGATQRRILALMAVEADAAIARRLGISTTTVRRHVKAIYTTLGVDNRFAAGAAAAKRGWL